MSHIEEEAWNDLEQYMLLRTFKKHEIVWRAGDVCKYFGFINYGLIHGFKEIDGRDETNYFFFENMIFCDDYSFVSQQPCSGTYEALEETEIVIVPRAALYQMYDKYKSFERLGRRILEHNHIALIELHQNTQRLSAEEKYTRLISQFPDVTQRISLKLIASYLNITPEHLSRIRTRL